MIELLVVLSIVAILVTAVTISAGAANREASIEHAFDDLSVTFTSLGTKAAMSQSPVRVELHPGTGRIVGRLIGAEDDRPILDRTLPHGVRVDAVEIDEEVFSDRTLTLLVQPSGYMREMRVALRLDEQVRSRGWDAIGGVFEIGVNDD